MSFAEKCGLLGCLLFLCLSCHGYHTATISNWLSWFPVCWFSINLPAVVLCMPWFATMVAPRSAIPPLLIVVWLEFWTFSGPEMTSKEDDLSFSSHAILSWGLMQASVFEHKKKGQKQNSAMLEKIPEKAEEFWNPGSLIRLWYHKGLLRRKLLYFSYLH